MIFDGQHPQAAEGRLGRLSNGCLGRRPPGLGRVGCDRVRELLREVVHERALELIECRARERALHVEDADDPIRDPKGDDERGSGLGIGAFESRVTHRAR